MAEMSDQIKDLRDLELRTAINYTNGKKLHIQLKA